MKNKNTKKLGIVLPTHYRLVGSDKKPILFSRQSKEVNKVLNDIKQTDLKNKSIKKSMLYLCGSFFAIAAGYVGYKICTSSAVVKLNPK